MAQLTVRNVDDAIAAALKERAAKAAKAVKEIVGLPDRHVALHLLRQSGDFCRMNYLARCG